MFQTRHATRAQSIFLRAFHNNPDGPSPDDWPSPAIFRRWLRSHRFRIALQTVRDAMRVRADLHLSAASSAAAHTLQSVLAATPTNPDALVDRHLQLNALTHLLRLAHLRQRFPSDPPPPPSPHSDLAWFIRLPVNQNRTCAQALGFYDKLVGYHNADTNANAAKANTNTNSRNGHVYKRRAF
jgi:hypothetical protein